MSELRINADPSVRAVVHAAEMEWTPSPTAGVHRRMLSRIGGEKARATSIVRYAPGSQFPRHLHPGSEETLVLDGVFQDERGDFPAGSYLRNAPGSRGGCVIFVKLWQFDRADNECVRKEPAIVQPGEARELFRGRHEHVRLERWAAGSAVKLDNPNGLELLVLSGRFEDGEDIMKRLSWLRLPPRQPLYAQAGPDGCLLWLKSGRVPDGDLCAF
jgi:anti-sigma factor ChrR (cupin superfamily)